MNTRSQIILGLFLILASAGVVWVLGFRGEGDEATSGGMEGHDHSAMAGATEAQPVTLNADQARRIGVTYATVTRGTLPRTVRTLGMVTWDETRLATVNPKIEGWVERLLVDFTGAPVRVGQPLMEVYSPPLVTAQEELLLARSLLSETMENGGRSAENARELLEAARRRLAYWDIPQEEIEAIEERGTVSKTLTLRAPAGGVVVEKNVVEGARIMPGMDLYRIADLSRVWVEGEVFERDMSLVREGQHAMVTFEAFPGEAFHGSVTYVHPTVSTSTRTGRIRVELSNREMRLKPGMYAEMELQGPATEETLLIPRSAVLETGKRSIVFHRMPDGQLHPMEVVTGLKSDDQVQVLSGLREGHVVVASATFLVDAESNLGAAMAGMAGMDHSGMEMGGEAPAGGAMDHSQHQTGGTPPDTTGATDHSGHSMGGTPPDTSGHGAGHAGHGTGAARPDTTGASPHRHGGEALLGRES